MVVVEFPNSLPGHDTTMTVHIVVF